MKSAHHIDENPVADPAAAFRLYQAAVAALAGSTAYFLWRSGGDLALSFILGLGLL